HAGEEREKHDRIAVDGGRRYVAHAYSRHHADIAKTEKRAAAGYENHMPWRERHPVFERVEHEPAQHHEYRVGEDDDHRWNIESEPPREDVAQCDCHDEAEREAVIDSGARGRGFGDEK